MTTEEKVAKVRELHAEGMSLREIAEHLGISHSSANNYLQQGRPTCDRCEITMREPSEDGLCGFCRVEGLRALAAPAPAGTFANGLERPDCKGTVWRTDKEPPAETVGELVEQAAA